MTYKLNKYNKYVYPSNVFSEYYETDGDKEIYITNRNTEVYAFNYLTNRQIYASDGGGHYYNKSNGNEIYAIDLIKEFEFFLNVNNQDIYCKTNTGGEYYPKHLARRDKVAKNNGLFYYAKNKSNLSFYLKDVNGDEFAVGLIITSVQGFPISPRKRNGFVNYIKVNGKEMLYESINQTFFWYKYF